jgi:hypothetical protein
MMISCGEGWILPAVSGRCIFRPHNHDRRRPVMFGLSRSLMHGGQPPRQLTFWLGVGHKLSDPSDLSLSALIELSLTLRWPMICTRTSLPRRCAVHAFGMNEKIRRLLSSSSATPKINRYQQYPIGNPLNSALQVSPLSPRRLQSQIRLRACRQLLLL